MSTSTKATSNTALSKRFLSPFRHRFKRNVPAVSFKSPGSRLTGKLLLEVVGSLDRSDESWVYENKVEVSVAVLEFKFCSPSVVVFVQNNWLSHDFNNCLLVFRWQIVKHPWWHFGEHNPFAWFEFHAR